MDRPAEEVTSFDLASTESETKEKLKGAGEDVHQEEEDDLPLGGSVKKEGRRSKIASTIASHRTPRESTVEPFVAISMDGAGAGATLQQEQQEQETEVGWAELTPARMMEEHLKRVTKDLADANFLIYFRRYLDDTYCSENLDFYEEAKKWVEDFPLLTAETRLERAVDLYSRYFEPGSSNELNLDTVVKEKVEKRISEQEIDQTMFQESLSAIFNLITSDSYPKFIASDLYIRYKTGQPLPEKGCRDDLGLTQEDIDSSLIFGGINLKRLNNNIPPEERLPVPDERHAKKSLSSGLRNYFSSWRKSSEGEDERRRNDRNPKKGKDKKKRGALRSPPNSPSPPSSPQPPSSPSSSSPPASPKGARREDRELADALSSGECSPRSRGSPRGISEAITIPMAEASNPGSPMASSPEVEHQTSVGFSPVAGEIKERERKSRKASSSFKSSSRGSRVEEQEEAPTSISEPGSLILSFSSPSTTLSVSKDWQENKRNSRSVSPPPVRKEEVVVSGTVTGSTSCPEGTVGKIVPSSSCEDPATSKMVRSGDLPSSAISSGSVIVRKKKKIFGFSLKDKADAPPR